MKKLTAIILTVVILVSMTPAALAANAPGAVDVSNLTIEQRVNMLTLRPQPLPNNSIYNPPIFPGILDPAPIVAIRDNPNMTNWEKLRATFMAVSNGLPRNYPCTTHTLVFLTALDVVGFWPYTHHVWGMTRSAQPVACQFDGTVSNWIGHHWVGLEIPGPVNVHQPAMPLSELLSLSVAERLQVGIELERNLGPQDVAINVVCFPEERITGEVIFLDTHLHRAAGLPFERTFAVRPSDATWYRDSRITRNEHHIIHSAACEAEFQAHWRLHPEGVRFDCSCRRAALAR